MTTATEFRAAMRAAAVELVTDFALDREIKLQVYRARPASLFPPTAFVERIRERVTFLGPTFRQRTPVVEMVVVHGLFDSGDAVDQADRFVDGFTEWVTERYHAAGDNTLIGAVSAEDNPTYIPDWLPLEKQRTYFATVISLEGLALD